MIEIKEKIHNNVLAVQGEVIRQVLGSLGKSRTELTEMQFALIQKTALEKAKSIVALKERKEAEIKEKGNSIAVAVLNLLDNDIKNNQGVMRFITEKLAPAGTKVYKKNITEVTTVARIENDNDIMAAFDLLNDKELMAVEATSSKEELTDEAYDKVIAVIPTVEGLFKDLASDIHKAAIKALAVKCNLQVMIK